MLAFAAFPLAAQEYIARVEYYGVEHGLSHRQVNAIFQDSRGYMWMGTYNGLNRFDGYSFRSYTKEKDGLPFNEILAIAEDADGWLWVSGKRDEGIYLFHPDRGEWRSLAAQFGKTHPQFVSETFLSYIVQSPDGAVWLSALGAGRLYRYHPADGIRAIPVEGAQNIQPVYFAPDKTIWALTENGIPLQLIPTGEVLQRFGQMWQGGLWGISENGIFGYQRTREPKRDCYYFDTEGAPVSYLPWGFASMKPPFPALIFPFDTSGTFVIHDRLMDARGNELAKWSFEYHGPNNFFWRCFYRDRAGRYWLGDDFGCYMLQLKKNRFQHFFHRKGAEPGAGNAIRGMVATPDKLYANVESSGLYEWDFNSGQSRLFEALPSAWGNYGLALSKNGRLWSGKEKALFQVSPGNLSVEKIEIPFDPWAFCEDDAGKLWIGCTNGLFTLAPGAAEPEPFTRYNGFNALASAFVLYIRQDESGVLWACTNNGFYKIDPDKGVLARYWQGGEGPRFLPADYFLHFYRDAGGAFWFATANGLLRAGSKRLPGGGLEPVWDEQDSKVFDRAFGLPNDFIYAVYEDRQGKLWMPTDMGIVRLDKKTEAVKTYFVSDGITHNEFNRAAHFRDKKGYLYFGGLNGVTAFDPAELNEQFDARHDLPLALTAFQQLDGRSGQIMGRTEELLRTRQIVLRPGDRFFNIELALLSFEEPSLIQYAWKMEGLDKAWNYQNERHLNFAGLPYGSYTLHIKAKAADGQWSNNELAFDISVLRPWYLQRWFLALSILLVFSSILAYIRLRNRQLIREQKKLQTLVAQATERIEQDKQIIEKQAEGLRRLDEVKSNFFANISHELRTPLTVILGITENLLREGGNTAAGHLQLIWRNGRSLLDLVNQLLDLAKAENKQLKTNLVQGDMVNYVRYIAESFHSMANHRNVILRSETRLPELMMDFDPEKIRQILSNLISNALKFTPHGGEIVLRLDKVESGGTQAMILEVSDTGEGIAPENLPHIFDRFYQAEHNANKAGGTGIGLALAKELVNLLGGGISATSQQGKGATFSVRLPISNSSALWDMDSELQAGEGEQLPPEAYSLLPPDSPPPTTGDSLLIIEDNPDVSAFLRLCLQGHYTLHFADNGRAGIGLALEIVPDLILSDVMMPEKDGFEVVETLKKDERTSHIPIVLLTARADVESRIAGLERGADDYLAKPFHRDELLIRIRNLLESRRRLRERYASLLPPEPTDDKGLQIEDAFLLRIRGIVEERLSDSSFEIDQLARTAGMSRSQLFRKVKALTGQSPSLFIRAIRLQRGKELLETTEMNVSEVAYEVGFSTPAYFSDAFAETYGVRPSQLKK
ncbi:MAG: response regulator [Lewinellaceae bacterium]|nr:response regulator [Lewinellaceae bacterium]